MRGWRWRPEDDVTSAQFHQHINITAGEGNTSEPTSGTSSWVWELGHQVCRGWWRCLRSTAAKSALQPSACHASERQATTRLLINVVYWLCISWSELWLRAKSLQSTSKNWMFRGRYPTPSAVLPLERSCSRSLRCSQLQEAVSFLFYLKGKTESPRSSKQACFVQKQSKNQPKIVSMQNILRLQW